MKKYSICALLILTAAISCFGAGYWTIKTQPYSRQETTAQSLDSETEGETETEPLVVINQKEVEQVSVNDREEFYLVSETGYLLVFAQDQSTICLYTHIPITEFPEKEQEKLRAGIWFPSMMEIFHYLESYTS